MTNDTDSTEFRSKAATYILPALLALAAYLAQASYARITEQLDRIESRQTSDMIALAELKFRVLQLENLVLRPGLTAKQAPAPEQKEAGRKPAIVYSQS